MMNTQKRPLPRPASRAMGPMVSMLVALALTGCPKRYVRDYAPPAGEALLQAVRDRQRTLHSMNVETRTTSWLGGERARATVLMLVDRAGKLRFEAEVSLKGTVAALATDGTTFSLIEMDTHSFRQGPACPRNVASLVRIPLSPKQIAAVLLGDVWLSRGARVKDVSWDADRGAEILEVIDAELGTSGHLWIAMRRNPATRSYAIIGVEGLADDGESHWRVAYHDLEPTTVDGVTIIHPDTVLFAEPGRSFDDGVEIKIKDRRPNPELADQVFTLAAPDGFDVFAVDCDEGDAGPPPGGP